MEEHLAEAHGIQAKGWGHHPRTVSVGEEVGEIHHQVHSVEGTSYPL